MAQVSFGTVLREARERKGYDVQSAARRLRIRPDILRAIENNDFSRLPARGYTRNMVNAYARLVGLNPGDITRMYLDEAYAYQVGRTRGESESPAHVSGRRSVSHHESRRASSRYRDEGRDEEERAGARSRSGRGREGGEGSQRTQRMQRSRSGRPSGRADSRPAEYRGTLAQRAARAESESRRGGHVGGAVTTQFTNFYSGSQVHGSQGNQTRLPYVIVAAVILVLLVIIIAMAFGNHGSSSNQDVAKVPITGVTDTSADGSGTSESSSNDSKSSESKSSSTAVVPTSVKVEYKLASGQQAYVVITQDGQASEQMLTGPVDETVEVSGTWSLATWVSSGFTVTMDGKDVEFANDATTGMPTATVNFKDYLASWAKEHPDVKVDGLDSSDSSTTSAGGSTASSTTGSTSSSASIGASTTSSTGTSTQSSTGNGTAVNTGTSTGTGSTGSGTLSSTYGSGSGGGTSSTSSGNNGYATSTSTYY